jgi:hypothetical protein
VAYEKKQHCAEEAFFGCDRLARQSSFQ